MAARHVHLLSIVHVLFRMVLCTLTGHRRSKNSRQGQAIRNRGDAAKDIYKGHGAEQHINSGAGALPVDILPLCCILNGKHF